MPTYAKHIELKQCPDHWMGKEAWRLIVDGKNWGIFNRDAAFRFAQREAARNAKLYSENGEDA